MVVNLRLQITGLPELNKVLTNIGTQLSGPIARRTLETSLANAKRRAQADVHVVSGTLRSSITTRIESDTKGVMFSNVDYALKEEQRTGGPKGPSHKYMQPAWEAERQAWPQNYLRELRAASRL